MSLKCCLTAGTIEISRELTPSSDISAVELSWVRFVVPNPGIVIPSTLSLGMPRVSNASTVTSSARVESSPPETPMTALRQRMWSSLVASPATCEDIISRHLRSSSSGLSEGTNGRGSMRRSSTDPKSAAGGAGKVTVLKAGRGASRRKACSLVRRASSFSTSMSAMIWPEPVLKRSLSARMLPYSQISEEPAHTRSCVDSP